MGNSDVFAKTAVSVGHWLGEHGAQLVYGGGNNGLMGLIAKSAQEAGARVIGVIPESMVIREWARHECDELIIVKTMHDRKRIMAEHANAFLALPGGIGTFEEFFETWTWKQLGYHNKPIGLLNTNGYFDSLIAFLENSFKNEFMVEHQMGLINIGINEQTLLSELQRQMFAESGSDKATDYKNI
jgi:uncharacterized protein (TIGR00730 family)